ncbi:response regulator [bacterium]|nr:response regulator [candidate division CSSED10-310 bacterium]
MPLKNLFAPTAIKLHAPPAVASFIALIGLFLTAFSVAQSNSVSLFRPSLLITGLIITGLGIASLLYLLLRSMVRLQEINRRTQDHIGWIERIGNLAYWQYSSENHRINLSRAAYSMLNHTPGTLEQAEDFLLCLDPIDRDTLRTLFLHPPDTPCMTQCRFILPTGDSLSIEWYCERRLSPHGDITGSVGIMRDVTITRKKETALRAAMQKTERALSLADMFEWEINPIARTLQISEHMGPRLFLDPGRYIFGFDEFLSRIDHEQRSAFSQYLAGNQMTPDSPAMIEFRFNRLDGEVFFLRWYGGTEQEIHASTFRHFGIAQDITVLREAETALLRSEEEKNFVIDSIDLGLALMTPDRRIIWTNAALCMLFNTSGDRINAGEICYRIKDSRAEPCPQCPIPDAIRLQRKVTREVPLGDRVFFSVTAVPSMDEYGEVTRIVTIVQDVTEQKKLLEHVLQTQRMDALARLARNIVHDFNNLLHVILGAAECADSNSDLGIREAIPPILEAARKGHDLIRKLDRFSRLHIEYAPHFVHLTDLLEETVESIKANLGPQYTISWSAPADIPGVTTDPTQVVQMVENLCTNACEAMPGGGSIALTADRCIIREEDSDIQPELKPGHYVILAVTDQGRGMTPEECRRVFEPFYTTKQTPLEGKGLGLSTVYAVMQRNKGAVTIDSKPGSGTSVNLFFPILPDGELDTGELKRVLKGSSGESPYCILLVEDDPTVRLVTTKTLEKTGFKLIIAADGQSAIDQFTEHSDQLDLVLLDVVLPRRSGREVYNSIHQSRPDLPIIFVTGYSADYLDDLPDNAVVIQKPWSSRELLTHIRKHLKLRS